MPVTLALHDELGAVELRLHVAEFINISVILLTENEFAYR